MERFINHDNYEAYLKHQSKKTLCQELRSELMAQFDQKVEVFEFMLRKLPKLMPLDSKVICLGSRMGEEVKAFHNLGFHNTFGIDIVSCPPFVIEGDFNSLAQNYEKNTFDIIYTNAIDHCWRMDDFLNGCQTVLKPNGILVLHLCLRVAREYETHFIHSEKDIIELLPNMEVIESEKAFLSSLGGFLEMGGMNHELILKKL